MKIKKIFLSFISLAILLGCSGKLNATHAPDIRVRCKYLIEKCGLYENSGWKKYVLAKMQLFGDILDYFCENRESFIGKGRLELRNIVLERLGCASPYLQIEVYDRTSIMSAENYEDFVYNLATVYLTYNDVFNPTFLEKRKEDDRRSLVGVELFWPKKDQADQMRMRVWQLSRQDNERVVNEIGKRMRKFDLIVSRDEKSNTSAEIDSPNSPFLQVLNSYDLGVNDGIASEGALPLPSAIVTSTEIKGDSTNSAEFSSQLLRPIASRVSRSYKELPLLSKNDVVISPRPRSVAGETAPDMSNSPFEMSDFVAGLNRKVRFPPCYFDDVVSSSSGTPKLFDADGKPLAPLKFGMPTKSKK